MEEKLTEVIDITFNKDCVRLDELRVETNYRFKALQIN